MPTDYDELADFYDYEWQDLRDDINFLAEECGKSGSPVLELACGTGRITIPLASNGLEVWGLDSSQKMLDILKNKRRTLPSEVMNRIHVMYGRMEEFYFDHQFMNIVVPFNSFLLLSSRKDQDRCLRQAWNHLSPEGRFIVDVFSPRFDLCAQEKSEIRFLKHFFYPPTNRVVIQWEYVERNMVEQVMDIDFLYELYDYAGNMERCTRTLRMAIIFRFELQHMLEKNGFEILEFYGNYDRTPFSKNSPQMIYICRKKTQ